MSLARGFALHFPITVGDLTVDVTAVDAAPDGVTITAQVLTREGGDLVDMREQPFVLERAGASSRGDRAPLEPGEIDVEALAANVRHHLGWASHPMPCDLFEPPAPYQRVGPFTQDWTGIEDVGAEIATQAWSHGFEMRYWVVAQWPEEARTAFFLHSLYAMAGGNGLEVFLHQNEAEEVMAVLDALRRAGCDRLARRYCEALAVAEAEGAEALLCADETWLDENLLETDAVKGPTPWRAIDTHEEGGTYWLIDHELRPAAAAFVRTHRALLLTED